MPRLAVGTENGAEVSLYYEDYGSGPPVVLVAGWPLTAQSWESQVAAFVEAGYRVVGYDRRGFGRSTRAWEGYDQDTLADDLHHLLAHLDLGDAALVGFSSGAGDVARCVARFGADRVSRLVLAGPLAVDHGLVRDLLAAAEWHRIAMLDDVLGRFFSVDGEIALDEASRQHLLHVAADASPKATVDVIRAWAGADPEADLADVDVPVLVVHGERDAFTEPGRGRAPTTIIPKAPHGAPITHPQQWNELVLRFLST
ncbi:pimeloyl-ACP methyl ester carboxylesterase [Saccharothrix saharensis]|uniref:Pimeloyl-ACP methyl ester carboxylesterase n=1 Tax=Saccharothrix saharensis TaxID=571190 RepID=A0A543JNR3_9PSEU|nr:alpha/beta hydrolase [Saccharothrix saharensis]TQM84476.1 pimeloyl-ACP methyl ester carboxylesterase [Saccharothrix saharensis]